MTEATNEAVLSVGEKVHVVFRRLFDGDVRRHFVGEIGAVRGDLVRAVGYTFVFDADTNRYERKPEERTRVFSLTAEINLNVVPASADISKVFYHRGDNGLVVTDGTEFTLDVNEFGQRE